MYEMDAAQIGNVVSIFVGTLTAAIAIYYLIQLKKNNTSGVVFYFAVFTVISIISFSSPSLAEFIRVDILKWALD